MNRFKGWWNVVVERFVAVGKREKAGEVSRSGARAGSGKFHKLLLIWADVAESVTSAAVRR